MIKIETMPRASNALPRSLIALLLSALMPLIHGEVSGQKSQLSNPGPFKPLVDQFVAPLVTGPAALRGLVIGVIHGGRQEVWGFGKVGPGGSTPDGETLFKIASVTKPLTALLLAQLAAEEKLSYSDTALTFQGKPVTYRQLVTHTSGLPVLPSGLREESLEEFRRFLRDYSLEREPGSQFEYSTTGYSALGLRLAEKCGAASFEATLTERILAPLGMSSTVFELPETSGPRFAGETLPPPRSNGPNPFNPAGGLISSANDLLRFVSANLHPDQYPALAKAIRRTHEDCPDVQPTFPGCSSALGWLVFNFGPTAKFYFLSGVTKDFRGFVAFDPAGDSGLVMLTNTDLSPADPRMEMAGLPLLGALAQVKLEPEHEAEMRAPKTGARDSK